MQKQIKPVFALNLDYTIVPSLITIGKYDGVHPCLTLATTTDKVLIHSPHRTNTSTNVGKIIWSEANKEIALLNINRTITALTSGILLPNIDNDVLIVGTNTHLLAYHVHDNKDIFYKECEDAVKSLALGTYSHYKTTIVVAGGNSSIHGYNYQGDELFWIAIGDIVTSIVLMDYNKDGSNQMIASSEDFNIRIFKDNEILSEHNETEIVTGLLTLSDNRFAYSVCNGTIGVYENNSRLWRIKSKNFAMSMHQYDLLGQADKQLITGWSNGKIDCRAINTGEVLFKDAMDSSIAGIIEGDYRSTGKNDLICVSIDGEVRGYTTTKIIGTGCSTSIEQDTIRELLTLKQNLLMELKLYESNAKYNANANNEMDSFETSGVIPSHTKLQVVLSTNFGNKDIKPHIEIYVCTNNSTIIKALIIFAEGIFKGESHVIHPENSALSSNMYVSLFLPRDKSVDIHLKALIGYPSSIQFHVFELTKQLPCFAMYALKSTQPSQKPLPEGNVQFKINERLQRICIWINQNFLFPSEIEFESGPKLTLNITCLRDNSDLVMVFEISGKVTFYTENMFLAADLIQCLAAYLKLDNLNSLASFPREEINLRDLIQKLADIQETRVKLETDIANRLSLIRSVIIQAEDSRINAEFKDMMDHYKELDSINKDLIKDSNIKKQNYDEGTETMKSINNIIQKASRLRVGQHSSAMINHCRNAIKDNNIEGLIRIIRTAEM